MNEILGKTKTIRELLSGTRYAIDYYQREYKWQSKHVMELLEDLTGKFLTDYEPGHEREMVQAYSHYFLGSIIISQKNAKYYIIDGQQRMTSLTLLLIYLHGRQGTRSDRVKLDDLIYAEKFGRRSFNLDVPEREPAMTTLFDQQPFDESDQIESVRNIVARYRDIEEHFPADIDEPALPYFVDWLIENVHLVEITAYSDDDAYTIFETMNDRGLPLTPMDMLKGFLLANITHEQQRVEAGRIWKERLGALAEMGKDEDADAVKNWLRSQYAKTIRDRKRGALPGDFDRLGTEFHRWVREHNADLELKQNSDYFRFIQRDMAFYTRQYRRIRKACQEFSPELECVYYNAQYEFTLQYPLLLAPLTSDDDEKTVDRKLRIAARFVDILLARRVWNFRAIDYRTMQYYVFTVMRDIRRKSPQELVEILLGRLASEEITFASNDRLRLHGQNGFSIKQLLARLTDHIQRESDMSTQFATFVTTKGASRFEIEHIWADHPERHTDEFSHPADFAEYRSRIGGLLLLPKPFNASYGDLPYEQKLEFYDSQNLLARSLHPKCYDHNPRFLWYKQNSKLPFKAHPHFKKADLDERQDLYRRIAEQIWDPERLRQELDN
jgi:uncharacterized protein with ParB-like and HNH nuclease domain